MASYLAECIEDLIEVDENLPLCDLCDIVHALAGVVPNTRILVAKAGKDWRYDFFEIASNLLQQSELVTQQTGTCIVSTHRSKSYRGCCKPDEATIPSMRLVDGVRILMAELMHNLGYPVVVLGSKCISDEALELEGSALTLVVELVVEGFSDVDVHVEIGYRGSLHVAAGEGLHTRPAAVWLAGDIHFCSVVDVSSRTQTGGASLDAARHRAASLQAHTAHC